MAMIQREFRAGEQDGRASLQLGMRTAHPYARSAARSVSRVARVVSDIEIGSQTIAKHAAAHLTEGGSERALGPRTARQLRSPQQRTGARDGVHGRCGGGKL